MEIKIKDIPDFLKDSDFYDNIDLQNDYESINIPKLKLDNKVFNLEDFLQLYRTLNFFSVRNYPENFIHYYQNNSQQVFELNLDKHLFLILCNLQIKNYIQFFVTYKIINLFELNPKNYQYYIDYALYNYNDLLGDDGNYKIDDIEFKKLADSLKSTNIIEFINIDVENTHFKVTLQIKKLYEKWRVMETLIISNCFAEKIQNLKNSIKNNKSSGDYGIEIMELLDIEDFPIYKNNKLTLMIFMNDYFFRTDVTITINEFNELFILNQLDLIINNINN